MFKKSIFVALLVCLAASTAFASFVVKTPINPVLNRIYTVTNNTAGNSFIVYSKYSGTARSQVTGSGNVYGLAVNPAGNKLYLSVDEGAIAVGQQLAEKVRLLEGAGEGLAKCLGRGRPGRFGHHPQGRARAVTGQRPVLPAQIGRRFRDQDGGLRSGCGRLRAG